MSKILVYPNESLMKMASEVVGVDKKLIEQIAFLEKELVQAENGAALAAPQVGILKRMIAVKDNNKKVKVFLNPKIVKVSGEKVWPMIERPSEKKIKQETENFLEGCLSFPGIFGTVKRWLKVGVEWQELIDGKITPNSGELSGFEAIVWQHESDHLDGILLIDHFKKEGGKVYKQVGEEMIDWSVEKI